MASPRELRRRYLKIEGYDSLEKFFEVVVPKSLIPNKDIVPILQRLASKHLTEREIVSSSLRRYRDNGRTTFLDAMISQGGRPSISVGENPWYTASSWLGSELTEQQISELRSMKTRKRKPVSASDLS